MKFPVFRWLLVFWLFSFLSLCELCPAADWYKQAGRQFAENMAKNFAPPSYKQPPEWSRVDSEPLFRIAWISDMHMDASRIDFTAGALAFVDERIKPAFVLITGDNNAIVEPLENGGKAESQGLARQAYLKKFLQKNLRSPYAIIPGDNWPQDFEKVFGPRQYSFDYRGIHFLMTAPDRSAGGKYEGLSVFDPATWEWMKKDLETNHSKPVIVVLHEPIVPPTFLDAERLSGLMEKYPNVLAAFQGHLHVDLEFEQEGKKYLSTPALGPSRPPAMKELAVYKDVIVIRTLERSQGTPGESGSNPPPLFCYTSKWQKIDIPAALRVGVGEPDGDEGGSSKEESGGNGNFMHNLSLAPLSEFTQDASLVDRLPELFGLVQRFFARQHREEVGKSLQSGN